MSWEKWASVTLPRDQVEAPSQMVLYFHLRSDIHCWLLDNAGHKARFFSTGPTGGWHHDIPISADNVTFYFRDPKVAMLLQLPWV